MNLSMNNQHLLLDLKSADDIYTTELIHEFSDDHIPCADAKINGVECTLFYCGSVTIGALEYADESYNARKRVFESLQAEISMTINSMFDFVEDELHDAITKDRFAYSVALSYIRRHGPDSDTWSEVAGYFENGENAFDIDPVTMTLK
jgi:hypothetical protein